MELKDRIKAALEQKRAQAAKAFKDFDDARTAAKAADVDLATDGEAFKTLEEKHKVYSTLADEQKQLEARLFSVYEMEGVKKEPKPDEPKPDDGSERKQSPGQRVVSSPQFKALLDSGVLGMERASITMAPVKALERAELKTLITGLSDTSGGAFVVNQRLAGMLDVLQRPLRVANLVTVSETDSDTVEWVKQDSFTNAAAEVLEATSAADGAKPESAMAFSVVSSIVQQIAHWIPVTRRALSDVAQMRDLIDSQLRLGVDLRLDSQMINGNGATPNLRGILNTVGIGTQALGTDSRTDALHKAITTVRLAFIEPTAVVLHPSDWEQFRLEKDANFNYIYGPPSVSGAEQIWGLRVIPSTVIAAGTGLVGDFSQAILWVREGLQVLATDSHSDFFIRNILVLLAEARYAFGVPRPAAFATVTGI